MHFSQRTIEQGQMSVFKIIILQRDKIYLQVIIQSSIKISKHVSTCWNYTYKDHYHKSVHEGLKGGPAWKERTHLRNLCYNLCETKKKRKKETRLIPKWGSSGKDRVGTEELRRETWADYIIKPQSEERGRTQEGHQGGPFPGTKSPGGDTWKEVEKMSPVWIYWVLRNMWHTGEKTKRKIQEDINSIASRWNGS